MSLVKFEEKLRTLKNDIIYGVDHEPAKRVIPKFYDMVFTIDQQMPDQKPQSQLSKSDRHLYQRLREELKLVKEQFIKYKQTRKDEILKFNQVEYYMYEETELILQKFQPPIIELIFDKFASFKRIFIKPETYYLEEEKIQVEDTLSTFSDKKTVTEKSSGSQKSLKIASSRSLPQNLDVTSMDKMWENVAYYYENHRLDEAYNQLVNVEQSIKSYSKHSSLTKQRKKLSQTIKFEHKTMKDNYEHFYDTGYTFTKQDKGISLWFKIIGQKDVAIKVQAEIDITIENFLCIASEIDLFEEYMAFAYDTKEVKSISRNQKIGTSKVFLPLLSDRQTYFYAAAYDRLRVTGSIFFFSKTINDDLQYQERYGFEVPKKTDYVRLDYKYYLLQYFPISKTRGKIRMVTSIDLKMDFLPLFVIRKCSGIFSYEYMNNFQKINKNFKGSKWEALKMKKKALYDYFEVKIDQYLRERQQK